MPNMPSHFGKVGARNLGIDGFSETGDESVGQVRAGFRRES